MEFISYTSLGVKNCILLLVPQYTKLRPVQLGKPDMGFHLLLFIFKSKNHLSALRNSSKQFKLL